MSIFEFSNKELEINKKKKIYLQVKRPKISIHDFYGGSLCRTEKRALFSIYFSKTALFDVSKCVSKSAEKVPKKVPNCIKIKRYESKYDNKKIIFFSKKHVSNDVSNGNTKSAELVVVLLFPKMFPSLKKMETKKY